MTHVRTPRTSSLAALAAVVLLGSCGLPLGVVDADGNSRRDFDLGDGLVQTVVISPGVAERGADIRVTSVIRNTGNVPRQLSARICALRNAGDLELTPSPVWSSCAAVSMTGDIAPGDSVTAASMWRVQSRSGSYTLRVEHLLSPSREVPMTVRVRD